MLTDTKAKKIKPNDKPLADGTVIGLRLLSANKNGRGKWKLRFVSPTTRKRRDMGLGTYPDISITQVRDLANAARKKIAEGLDPIEEKANENNNDENDQPINFQTAANLVYNDLSPGWKNEKHKAQWISTIKQYVNPSLGSKIVGDLKPKDFAQVLRPIWLTKPETASRVKQRCSTIIKWCYANGHVSGNPIDAVDFLLPKQPSASIRTKHFPSMPWEDIPSFISNNLSNNSSIGSILLNFVIHTASRSGEARFAKWDEIDFKNKVWTIPARRMKGKQQHRVPLTPFLLDILNLQKKVSNQGFIFKTAKGSALSDMALTKILRDKKASSDEKGRHATVHGFRASFRNWASENGYARDLAERALAHVIKSKSEAAYHRTDLLENRRRMMAKWSDFLVSEQKK